MCCCFDFAFLRSVIGLKKYGPLLDQSEVSPKPSVPCLHAFSRARRLLHVLALSLIGSLCCLRLL